MADEWVHGRDEKYFAFVFRIKMHRYLLYTGILKTGRTLRSAPTIFNHLLILNRWAGLSLYLDTFVGAIHVSARNNIYGRHHYLSISMNYCPKTILFSVVIQQCVFTCSRESSSIIPSLRAFAFGTGIGEHTSFSGLYISLYDPEFPSRLRKSQPLV